MKKFMKYNQIYLFALLALLFMACSGDDEKVSESDAITFLSQAGSFSGSSELGQWQSGDQIGVYMFESGTTIPLSNASNVIYTAGSTGAITTFSSTTPLQFSGNESLVSFAAYYPYSSAVSNLLYPISLADQTGNEEARTDDSYHCSRRSYVGQGIDELPASTDQGCVQVC